MRLEKPKAFPEVAQVDSRVHAVPWSSSQMAQAALGSRGVLVRHRVEISRRALEGFPGWDDGVRVGGRGPP